ncbi:hypothetical protein EVAR_55149_1 [Eumeta japonica]|uniref:Reverse transcriptase domain-containing protein n=1 Tax=Eumeta variegata TaxID=151549 RepID=A0A4C1Y842_EUMVA|nr:hypothetical protein EVAR_55149_1 [Eumeta japonica]
MITEVQKKKLVVGYNLFHPTSNHLGSFLLDFCEQHNLVISSTWGRRSCKQGQNPLDWNQLNEILRSSVIEHLKFNKNKSKTSRLALAKFMKAKFWKNRSPKDPATIQNFKDARKELLDLQEKEDEEKCQHFFAQMHKVRRSQRMKMTYEFLRTFKKQTGRKQPKRFIPISTWIYELHKVKGPEFRISQSDKKAIKSPSTDTINNIIKQMKKRHSTRPGSNEWVETIQIPIPKKARPQSVNDYRKISICNAGYRIYATYLLKLLDEEIETMGNYQAAFMRYRSTDDHIFVVRRILDENGRQNHVLSQRTYVNPMVWTKPKVSPKEKGQTRMSTLTSAFTIVLDDVLRTLEELVSEVRLDQDAEINLPVILSFADDIIIIGNPQCERSHSLHQEDQNALENRQVNLQNGNFSLTYGLNVVALTKSNRTRLRQYEREILKDMLQAARNQPKLKHKKSSKEKQSPKSSRYTTTERKVGRPIYTWEDSLRQDLNYHNRNQEEWDTLAQNKMEMKKAADELYQLPETDTESSAPSEENEE